MPYLEESRSALKRKSGFLDIFKLFLTKQQGLILKATILIFLQTLLYFNVISQVTGKDETISSKEISGIEQPKVSFCNLDSLEKANSDQQFSARNKRIHKEGSHYY
jgi:hypothetical protein